MRKIYNILFLAILLNVAMFIQTPLVKAADGIVVVVNDGIVSKVDVEDRLKLALVSSGLPDTADVRDKLRPQIVDALIDETIKLQELKRLGFEVEDAQVDQGFKALADQNKFTPEQFTDIMRRSGINVTTLRNQIYAQAAWSKIVQTQVGSKIIVSEFDIDDMQERLNNDIGTTEYLAAEIILPVNETKDEGKTRKLAKNLAKEIRSGKVRFSQIAQQFSKAPGANRGGDMGWVQASHVDDELRAILEATPKGTISDPTRTKQGYTIILVREIREVTAETIPSREEIRAIIGNQRVESGQRRYLMDLKSGAFIDRRG